MRRPLWVGLVICLAALVPGTASAQDRGDFAIGYTFRHLGVEGASVNLPLGVSFSAADRVSRMVSVVGELTESRRSESDGFDTVSFSYLTFAGGIRISKREERRSRRPAAQPFVEVLVGGSRLSIGFTGEGTFSGSSFHIEPKGGVDLPMGRRTALRAAVGFELEHADGWAHTVRVDLAAVFPFGRGR